MKTIVPVFSKHSTDIGITECEDCPMMYADQIGATCRVHGQFEEWKFIDNLFDNCPIEYGRPIIIRLRINVKNGIENGQVPDKN